MDTLNYIFKYYKFTPKASIFAANMYAHYAHVCHHNPYSSAEDMARFFVRRIGQALIYDERFKVVKGLRLATLKPFAGRYAPTPEALLNTPEELHTFFTERLAFGATPFTPDSVLDLSYTSHFDGNPPYSAKAMRRHLTKVMLDLGADRKQRRIGGEIVRGYTGLAVVPLLAK
jgi:hypothetical protein